MEGQVLDVTRYYAGASLMLPELLLGFGAAILLVFEAFAKPVKTVRRPAAFAAALLVGALVLSLLGAGERATVFSGMVVLDPFVDFFRVFSCLAGLLGILVSLKSDEIEVATSGEYYSMFVALVLGMILMASASDLAMMFIAVELVSLMSYVLAGFRKHDRKGAEAALKYVIYGGAASGVMVFGFSLLYGITGQTQLSLINTEVMRFASEAAVVSLGDLNKLASMPPALTAGMILAFSGFAYKIAAVPLHMWSPDVYEGAPTPFTAFLSTGPKAAGFAVLLRFFVVGFSDQASFANNLLVDISTLPWLVLVIVVSIATMTLGNLAAIGQSNIKRFLAYSSIAHAGYALIGLAAFSRTGAASVLLYMTVYLVMNIGSFYVVIWVRDKTGSELIEDYKGMGTRNPFVCIVLTLCFVSLTGLPPLAGFIAKYKLFAAALERAFDFEPLARCAPDVVANMGMMAKANCALSGSGLFYALGIAAVVNSAISLYYYFRVVRKMFLEKPDDPTPIPTDGMAKLVLVPVTVLLFFFGLFPDSLERATVAAIEFQRPTIAEIEKLPTPSLPGEVEPAAAKAAQASAE
ncbi:MAG: NADH-quinone oxidoreductase subunit N [Deltaproteobacteria bacterium]